MAKLKTQTENFWEETFAIRQSDIDFLYQALLEKETPMSLDEMALLIMRNRVAADKENAALQLREKPKIGEVYRPSQVFKQGDELILSQFENQTGTVQAIRKGENPEYGDFSVITVVLENKQQVDLAASFSPEHSLSKVQEKEKPEKKTQLSPEQLFIEFGGAVVDALEEHLQGHDDIVRLAAEWFPKSLLVEINEGHLNLAEAVLFMNDGGPLTTGQIVDDIGMLGDIPGRLADFSFNYAMLQDERFDEVGPTGQVLWYLKTMEPAEVLTPPPRLEYQVISYDFDALSEDFQQLELEIEDEHSQLPRRRIPRPDAVDVILTYPHWRSGTLPLSYQLRRMFPTAHEAPRIRFTLFDENTGDEMPGWVARTGGYVYGLAEWLRSHAIPVGAIITISRMNEDQGIVKIGFEETKGNREYVLTARVANNRVKLALEQRQYHCAFDPLMVIDPEDPDAVDALWLDFQKRRIPFDQIVQDMAKELVALSPQSHFQAKTLYTVVNMLRRCPPGPIFALLETLPSVKQVGGTVWQFQE